MKKLLLLCLFVLLGTRAYAAEFIETFDDPLGGWRDRWLAAETNLQNYYICSGSTTDENYRGNNPCGIWICDGVPDGVSVINFNAGFGASIRTFEIGVQAFVDATINVYDTVGGLIYSTPLPTNYNTPYGCFCTTYTTPTPAGVGRFEIVSAGGGVEGNMAIDNVRVVTEGEVPVEPTTWGAIKSQFR
jgi:hypothetical protein